VSSLTRTPRIDAVQDNGALHYAEDNDAGNAVDNGVAERNPADEPGPERT
jgi:hypothetical protein